MKKIRGDSPGESNQCRTQTYFRTAETVWVPKFLRTTFVKRSRPSWEVHFKI